MNFKGFVICFYKMKERRLILMKGLSIRNAISSDIPSLIALDHGYSTDHVWQMAMNRSPDEVGVTFRQVRLPRPMRVTYPRDPQRLADEWLRRSVLLVAENDGLLLGYLALVDSPAPRAAWITDLVVGLRHRRQGVATALLEAVSRWCREQEIERLILEMQSKNFPGICLSRKQGFVFAGYNDRYFPDQDIALIFLLEF